MPIQNMSPDQVRRWSLLIAVLGAVVCITIAYFAAKNELTGTATFVRPGRGSGRSEHVTRTEAPAKFRQATNELWAGSVFSLLIGAGGFVFYRRLGDQIENTF